MSETKREWAGWIGVPDGVFHSIRGDTVAEFVADAVRTASYLLVCAGHTKLVVRGSEHCAECVGFGRVRRDRPRLGSTDKVCPSCRGVRSETVSFETGNVVHPNAVADMAERRATR